MRYLLLLPYLWLFLYSSSYAVSTNSMFGATLVLNQALGLTTNSQLSFGSIIPNSGGTVSVSSTGFRTTTGAIIPVNSYGWSAASFTVVGSPLTAYSITLPSSSSLNGPGQSLSISFPITLLSGGSLNRSLNGVGTDTFSLGAIVNIGNNPTPGTYSGTYTITVSY